MSGRSLEDWLDYVERVHPQSIALGLERVEKVRGRLGRSTPAVIFTVAGTNGKGSTCAMLESILLSARYKVGLYTSPHLLRYNERVRLGGTAVSDMRLCAAFENVERARGEITLTYFEFGTLVAWEIFTDAALDAVILEVGLGGRLDATNVFDCDCAVLTTVALDHMDYLGDTREEIGAEKAGIFRRGKPAIAADPDVPRSVVEHAKAIGADLRVIGRDFGYEAQGRQWQYWGESGRRSGLAYPALRGSRQLVNASAALAALDTLRMRVPVGMQDVRNGLAHVELPARFQVLPGRPRVVLDVAHNPDAAKGLAENLGEMGFFADTLAVFGMLRDKDVAGVCSALKACITLWFVSDLSVPRGASSQEISQILVSEGVGVSRIFRFESPGEAYAAARKRANENDRIAVFGSFHTVAGVMKRVTAGRTA